MPEVLRLKNPKALLLDPVQNLIRKALSRDPAIDFNDAMVELAYAVQDPYASIALATDDAGIFRGLCIVRLPRNALDPHPYCQLLFAEGGAKVRNALIEDGVAFVKEHSYDHIRGINQSGKPDAVWLKTFKHGMTPKPVGSLVEFSLE